jgi:WD40 repeat protein
MSNLFIIPFLLSRNPKNAYARMDMMLRANILDPIQYHSVIAKSFMLTMLVRRLVNSPSNRTIIIRRIICKILGRKVPKVGVTFYPEMYGHIGGTNMVDFHSYFPLFATCGNSRVILWQISTDQLVVTKKMVLEGHKTNVNSVVFCKWNLRFIMSACDEKTILWQMTECYSRVERMATLIDGRNTIITGTIVHPTLPVFATFNKYDNTIHIWKIDQLNLEKSVCIARIQAPVKLVIFHPSLPILISFSDEDGNPNCEFSFWDFGCELNSTITRKLRTLCGFPAKRLSSPCFTYSRENFFCTCMSFHENLPIFACGDCNGKLLILDMSNYLQPVELVFMRDVHCNIDNLTSISFSKRKPIMATTDDNGMIRIWSLNWEFRKLTITPILQRRKPGSDLTDCSFHPNKDVVVTTSKSTSDPTAFKIIGL